MQYSTWQHLEHSSTVQHPDGKTLRCDSDDWPVPVVLADRFALLSSGVMCKLPPPSSQLHCVSFASSPTQQLVSRAAHHIQHPTFTRPAGRTLPGAAA